MLLDVKQLTAHYIMQNRVIKAVDGVDFDLSPGEFLGLVGESGSGKSTIGYSLMGYLPPPGKIVSGKISFNGLDLIKNSRKLRWKNIAIIFQGAMNAMNPVMKVGDQIDEVLKIHMGFSKKERMDRINELIQMVNLNPKKAFDYPHQLSGGMKQRIMIAMALACEPEILIADEPTSNLDVITEKKIVDLLKELKDKLRLSIIYISHDLPLILKNCKRVAVLHKGKIIESGLSINVFNHPHHPHTRRLINSILRIR